MKVALVTGGTSGIGADIVGRFTGQGIKVVFNGRRRRLGERVAEQTGATFVQADLMQPEATEKIFEAVDAFGRLDILVNNAGGMPGYGGIESEYAVDCFADQFTLHVLAAVSNIRRALPLLHKSKGLIINIASVAAHLGMTPGCAPPYVASKAALIGLTHSMADELAPFGVRVYALSPNRLDCGFAPVTDAVMALVAGNTTVRNGANLIMMLGGGLR